MAFDNGIYVEINGAIGSDTANGGMFSPVCTGFATDLTATVATSGAPIVSSASYTFISRDVNQYLFIAGGTNWATGFYLIASVTGGSATLTATVGSVVLYNGTGTPVNTVTGCATTASPTGGHWGIDYSRGSSPVISYTDLVIDGTTNTKVTSVGNPIGPNVVGNTIVVTSGSGFTLQRVEFVSVSGTTGTVDKSLGSLSSTGGNAGLGGCLASPGTASGLTQSSNSWYGFVVGNHTYNMISTTNVAGGAVTNNQAFGLIGYNTNRYPFNLDSNRPVFQAATSNNSFTLVHDGGTTLIHNIDFENGNSSTSISAYTGGGPGSVWNCTFHGMSIAFQIGNTTIVQYCDINGCTNSSSCISGSTDRSFLLDCVFRNNSGLAADMVGIVGCIFYNNGIVGNGFTNGWIYSRNLFHTNTGTGTVIGSTVRGVENSIFVNNTGTGFVCIGVNGTTGAQRVLNNAFYGNTINFAVGTGLPGWNIINTITLTGDPCNNASGNDFSLNNTAGAGALLRGQGFPINFPGMSTTNSLDVGPMQHLATAGGAIGSNFGGNFCNG